MTINVNNSVWNLVMVAKLFHCVHMYYIYIVITYL